MTDPLFASANGARHPEDRSPPVTKPNGAETPPMANAVGLPRPGLRRGEPVLGYVTAPGSPDATGLDPSQRAIELACRRAGWRLLDVLRENGHRGTERRPVLLAALERIADGEARGLVVSHARMLGDFDHRPRDAHELVPRGARRLHRARPRARHVDATGHSRRHGADQAQRMASRRRGRRATQRPGSRWAPATARTGTVHARRRPAARAELLRRLAAMEDDDMSLQEMADQLNTEGVPTLNGSESGGRRPSGQRCATPARHPLTSGRPRRRARRRLRPGREDDPSSRDPMERPRGDRPASGASSRSPRWGAIGTESRIRRVYAVRSGPEGRNREYSADAMAALLALYQRERLLFREARRYVREASARARHPRRRMRAPGRRLSCDLWATMPTWRGNPWHRPSCTNESPQPPG